MAYAPMFEMWRRVEDGVAYDIALDLGYVEEYPLAGSPWFFGVRLPMARTEEDGLPGAEETQRLNHVENRVREIVRTRDGLYVGRVTGGGNRDLIFYLPGRPRGLEDRLRASVGMEVLFISRNDAGWQAYERLLPAQREMRQIEDLRTMQALVDHDTVPELLHRVEHRVETSSQKGAEALVKLFEKLELVDCEILGQRPELVVSGVQETPLDLEAIHRVSWILDSKAPKAKGRYLGWKADPVLEGEGEEAPEDPEDVARAQFAAILEALSTGKTD